MLKRNYPDIHTHTHVPAEERQQKQQMVVQSTPNPNSEAQEAGKDVKSIETEEKEGKVVDLDEGRVKVCRHA